MSAFLVDTSFLISLADPGRPNHAKAAACFREALRQLQRDAGDDRSVVKDDAKLIARPILLRAGFDSAGFNNGQKGLLST